MSNVSSIKVRMYNTGSVGDCLLLLFYKGSQISFRMLIDCGGFNTNAQLISPCVEDIKTICGGKLDLLVVTHQHLDHISGFNQARKVFDDIEVKDVWMSWIEKASDPIGKILRERYGKKVAELKAKAEKAAGQLKEMKKKKYIVPNLDRRFLKKEKRMINAVKLLDFEQGISQDKGLAARLTNDSAMEYLRDKGTIGYRYPGEVMKDLPGAEGIKFFILGPPRDADMKFFKVPKDDDEIYKLAASSDNEGQAEPSDTEPILNSGITLQERRSPFTDQYLLRGSAKKKFFSSYNSRDMQWRQIETDWQESSASLAMRVTSLTNNTSLAMAIEFEDSGKVMLMPGDAQSGNWMSWHKSDVMQSLFENGGKTTVELLGKTVFYKVGHHGSENGTASYSGLEYMKDPALVAFMPLVENKVPDEWGGSKNFPAKPLYKKLLEKTRGRLIRTDQGIATSAKAKEMRSQLSTVELNNFESSFKKGNIFVEFTIKE